STCHERKRSGRSSRRTAHDRRRCPGALSFRDRSLGACAQHMQNERSGYTFDAAGPPSVTAKAAAPAGGAVDGFLLAYDGFDPGSEGLREALTSTGNGYLCTRGAAEWEEADGVHYPGTYAHGGDNPGTAILGGRPARNPCPANRPI